MDTAIIKFRNNEIIINEYNKNLKLRTDVPLSVDDIERYYNTIVEFEDDLTVEGFITALKPFFSKIDKQFIAYTRGFELMHYYVQMQKPAKKEKKDPILYVEFCWSGEISEHENVEEGTIDSDFTFDASYHGFSLKEKAGYSFSLSPINEWKHYLLKLNKKFKGTFSGHDENDDLVMKTLFESTREYTLHELIKYFVYELTWMGYTDHIIEKGKELDQQVKDIESGKEKTVEFDIDEWMIGFYEKDLKRAVKEDRFEAAERIRNKIDRMRMKQQKRKQLKRKKKK